MSKAVKMTLEERLRGFLGKVSSVVGLSHGSIPALGLMPALSDLGIPPLPTIPPVVPVYSSRTRTSDDSKEPVGRTQNVIAERPVPELEAVEKDDVHREVVSILERKGYTVEDVTSLPSGEKLISVSEILSQFDHKSEDYEYAHRTV